MSQFSDTFLLLLTLGGFIISKPLLVYELSEHTAGTAESDLIKGVAHALKNSGNGVFTHNVHEGLYALVLNQDRHKVSYVTKLTLGEGSGTELEFAIDTGSSWLWIFEKDCTGALQKDCQSATGNVKYRYFDGDIEGPIGETTISLQDSKSPKQSFLVVKKFTKLMKQRILGLSKNHNLQHDNFLATLKKNGLIDEIAFSFFRNPITEVTKLIIGGEDKNLIQGEKVAEMKIIHPKAYMINLESVSIGGHKAVGSASALLDTGNTLICFPMRFRMAFGAIFKKIGIHCDLYKESNTKFYQLGCVVDKDFSNVPKLDVVLGGVTFNLLGKNLMGRCKESATHNANNQKLCLLLIEFQVGGQFVILGKAFLTHTYTTFFLDKGEIWLSQPGEDKYRKEKVGMTPHTEFGDIPRAMPHRAHDTSNTWTEEEYNELVENAKEMVQNGEI